MTYGNNCLTIDGASE